MSDSSSSTSPPRLVFEEVSRQYPRQDKPAVKGVSLEVEEGEVFSLLGESGSGKTTLLRLAAGLETPDSGSVFLDGVCVAGQSRKGKDLPPEKRRIGLVFQDGALFPHLTVTRNVAFGLSRWEKGEREERIRECLALVELSGFEHRYPHELSGGEGQRLSLARALAPRPRLLLLDEPFSHLDPALRRKLRDELGRILKKLDQTVLLVTHDPEDAMTMASRVAILVEGSVRQIGAPAEVYRDPVDRYCAERFGPINEVNRGKDGEVIWRRPEEALWMEDEEDGPGEPCVVEEVRAMGREFEVRVRREEHPISWILAMEKAPLIGAKGRVRWLERGGDPGGGQPGS